MPRIFLKGKEGSYIMQVNDLCINCFAKKGKTAECQRCGYVDGTPPVAPYLAQGTVLAERFVVGRHEKVTGEGVTYLGYDAKKNEKVVIREYLPLTLCSRKAGRDEVMVKQGCELTYEDYKQDFFDIAKAVTRLSDIDIFTPIRAIFECNNTAYAVYDKPDGRPLGDIVKKAQRLTWDEARPLFLPLIGAMNSAHAVGLVHFGISPETIYFSRDKKLHVTGFAIPDSRMSDTALKCEMYDGYSAIEQYSAQGKRGRSTDVYAMCALLFYTLTGKRPPEAVTRAYEPRLNMPAELAEEIPSHVVAALAAGLQVMPENRIQTMDELRSQLSTKSGGAAVAGVARAAGAGAAVGAAAHAGAQQSRPHTAPPTRTSSSQRERQTVGRTSAAAGVGYAASSASPRQRSVDDSGNGSNGGFYAMRSNLSNAFNDLGGKVSSKLSAFSNLKQWQYLLLSLVISIVILGIIAIVVLSVFSPYLRKNSSNYIQPPEEYIIAPSETDTTPTYEVPNFVGKEWEDVKATASTYYYFEIYALAEEEASSEYKEGEIIRQSVDAGSMAPDGTVISVVLSSGSSTVKIPKIIGKSVYEAQELLSKSGLRLGEQVEEYNDEYEFGVIFEVVNADVGDKVGINSYINVKVSKGPEPTVQIVEDEE